MSSKSKVLGDATELRVEANEARYLASTFKDRATVSDLLNYAAALEHDAARWEALRNPPGVSMADYFASWWNAFGVRGQQH